MINNELCVCVSQAHESHQVIELKYLYEQLNMKKKMKEMYIYD